MEDSVKPADKFREILGYFPGVVPSENVPIFYLGEAELKLERNKGFHKAQNLPSAHFFRCDGGAKFLWSPQYSDVHFWEDKELVFVDWNIFIGLNEIGLITFIILRQGFEGHDQLRWIIHNINPSEIAERWRQKIHSKKWPA